LIQHVSPAERYRVQRKLTIQESQKKSSGIPDSPLINAKPNSAHKKAERKGSNPEKK
jgi:hypothetical protein